MTVLKADPTLGEPLHLLGIIAADHDNHTKAVELQERAIRAGAAPSSALAQKARSLIALNRREEAIEAADAAAKLDGASAMTLDTIGVVFSRAGLHARAVPFYQRAVALAPDKAPLHYNLGAALQFTGDLAAAKTAYVECLRLDPSDVRAMTGLVQVERQTPETARTPELEEMFKAVSDANAKLKLAHALAKTHEDLGDLTSAMAWLACGKAAKRAVQPYDEGFDRALFAAAIRTPVPPATSGHADAAPIFITGLPRTGTTLCERILSSHGEVGSAGELTDFGLCLKRLAGTNSRFVLDAETLDAAVGVDMAELGRAYIERVKRTLGLTGRFIDKMPLNIFYAPLILSALPNARIICLRRHPADSVLSNYRQLFATSYAYYNYALGLESAAEYYVGFDRMVARFRETLPADRFTELHYETLVSDLEGETRRLLDFCGLTFEPACLAFHENAAPVATASSVQVRQPLYSSSIGRWRKVESEMVPALEVLRKAGLVN